MLMDHTNTQIACFVFLFERKIAFPDIADNDKCVLAKIVLSIMCRKETNSLE